MALLQVRLGRAGATVHNGLDSGRAIAVNGN
jgi:hypothetical protein